MKYKIFSICVSKVYFLKSVNIHLFKPEIVDILYYKTTVYFDYICIW